MNTNLNYLEKDKIFIDINNKAIKLDIKPITVNSAYKYSKNGVYLSDEAKKYKMYILNELSNYKKIKGKIKLIVKFYFKDKRKRDIDNYLKIFIDSIKNVIIDDDSEIQKITASKEISFEYKILFKIVKLD